MKPKIISEVVDGFAQKKAMGTSTGKIIVESLSIKNTRHEFAA